MPTLTPTSTALPVPKSPPTPGWVESECIRQRIDRVAACKDYRDHTPPLFSNLMVEIGPWDKTTNRAGAFVFDRSKERVFIEFGRPYLSVQGTVLNATFTYDLPSGTSVIAPLDGVVTRIEYQPESDDYELELRSSLVSDWSVIIDHVKQVQLVRGDMVKARQIIGLVSLGRTGYSTMPELQVNEEIIDEMSTFAQRYPTKVLFHCPSKFVNDAVTSQVLQLMRDWETFKGKSIYPSGMVRPGCTSDTISP